MKKLVLVVTAMLMLAPLGGCGYNSMQAREEQGIRGMGGCRGSVPAAGRSYSQPGGVVRVCQA